MATAVVLLNTGRDTGPTVADALAALAAGVVRQIQKLFSIATD